MSSVTVVAKLTADATAVRLAVDTDPEFPSPIMSAPVATIGRVARMTVSGLAAGTSYYCAVAPRGAIDVEAVGQFTTPLASGPMSFRCAFAGDCGTGTNHAVFQQIVAKDPLFFIHLGDLHYENINVNNVASFLAAFDAFQSQPNPAQLIRKVPTLYTWDDHDYGPNDSHAASPGRAAACEAYRIRVPHPPLVEPETTGAVYFTHRVGRVLFIVTDQRSRASNKTAADNSSKTILGTAQKTWMKGVLADPANSDTLFVWACSRAWGGVPTSGADHWGGFTTERTELADFVKANCPGRFVVLSADMHSLAIDNGANHDFATGGGGAIPTFQAAPLDRTGNETYGGGTYSEGGRFMTNGQFGTMEITDTGAGTIGVSWKGYNSTGSLLVQHDFSVTVGA